MERNLREVFGQRDSDRRKIDKPLRVGMIGLSAERGWATAAHIPALRALSNVICVTEPALRRVLMMRLLFTEPFPQSKSPQKPANACGLVADGGDDSATAMPYKRHMPRTT
jgi:hypothetical protein